MQEHIFKYMILLMNFNILNHAKFYVLCFVLIALFVEKMPQLMLFEKSKQALIPGSSVSTWLAFCFLYAQLLPVTISKRGHLMNQIIKNLHDVKEKIRAKWDKLTDQDITESRGNVDDLQGRLKKAYGYDDTKTKSEFDEFTTSNDLQFEDSDSLLNPEDPTVSPAAPIVPRTGKIFQ